MTRSKLKDVPSQQHEPIRIDKHGLFTHQRKAYRVPKAVRDSDGYTLVCDLMTKEPITVTDRTGNEYEFEKL